MASYILRQIDPKLWHRVKVKALSENLTIKALIEKLISEWLARK